MVKKICLNVETINSYLVIVFFILMICMSCLITYIQITTVAFKGLKSSLGCTVLRPEPATVYLLLRVLYCEVTD